MRRRETAVRELTEPERMALEPEVRELEETTRAVRELEQRQHEIEGRLQRMCSLMVEEGQVVDLENMTVVTLNTEDGNAKEGREQDR